MTESEILIEEGKVHSTSESERITEILRSEILTGEWAEGSPLREVALAERFKIRRGTIREVLRNLTHEGLTESRPNCGVRIAAAPSNELEPLIGSLRRQIESFALQTCFPGLNESVFEKFEGILKRMKQACELGDHSAIAEADVSFHRLIVELPELPDLLALWLPMLSRLRTTFIASQKEDPESDLMCIYHEHSAILSAMRAGKVDPAIQLLEASID